MSQMVEEVARAIACTNRLAATRSSEVSEQQKVNLWDSLSPETKDVARREARAAIEAMREPTKDMLDAGIKTGTWGVNLVWLAMIDEALK